MDTFAGSEPRIFISFCLGNESSGQLAPESVNMVDSTATKPDNTEQAEVSSDDSIEVIEITVSSPERVESAPNSPCKVVVKLEPEELTSQPLVQTPTDLGFTLSSSDSSESVGAFFTRKLKAFQTLKLESTIAKDTAKHSERDGFTRFPNYEFASPEHQVPCFIGSYGIPQDTVNESLDECTFPSPLKHTSAQGSAISCQDDQMSTDEAPVNVHTCTPSSEVEMGMTSDQASLGQARSTLADAMAPPKTRVVTCPIDGLDNSLPEMEATKEKTPALLSIKSRDLIREYFAETRPINLPQGHPLIVLNPRSDEQCFAYRCGRNRKSLIRHVKQLRGQSKQT